MNLSCPSNKKSMRMLLRNFVQFWPCRTLRRRAELKEELRKDSEEKSQTRLCIIKQKCFFAYWEEKKGYGEVGHVLLRYKTEIGRVVLDNLEIKSPNKQERKSEKQLRQENRRAAKSGDNNMNQVVRHVVQRYLVKKKNKKNVVKYGQVSSKSKKLDMQNKYLRKKSCKLPVVQNAEQKST